MELGLAGELADESGVWGGVGTGSWVGGIPPVGDPSGIEPVGGSLGDWALTGCVLWSFEFELGVGLDVELCDGEFVGAVWDCDACGCPAGLDWLRSCAHTGNPLKISKLREISDLRNNIEHPAEPGRLSIIIPPKARKESRELALLIGRNIGLERYPLFQKDVELGCGMRKLRGRWGRVSFGVAPEDSV